MDTLKLSQQARPPQHAANTPAAKRLTGVMPLVIGGCWMLETEDGRRIQYTALDLSLVLAEAKKEGRTLTWVWRDLSTGKDWESPAAHREAYPNDAAMMLANEVHVCAWLSHDFADPEAQKKADDLARENAARRKLCAEMRKKLDSAPSIEDLDAGRARIDSVERMITLTAEKIQNILDTRIGLASTRWHPDLHVPTAAPQTTAPVAVNAQ